MSAPRTHPSVQAQLDKLGPETLNRYEIMAAGWREEWALKQALSAEIDAAHRLNARERLARAWGDVADGLSTFALIAVICIGGAGLVGACIGVLVALIRAGWRAGATL